MDVESSLPRASASTHRPKPHDTDVNPNTSDGALHNNPPRIHHTHLGVHHTLSPLKSPAKPLRKIMAPTLYPRGTVKKIVKAHSNRQMSKNVDILVRRRSTSTDTRCVNLGLETDGKRRYTSTTRYSCKSTYTPPLSLSSSTPRQVPYYTRARHAAPDRERHAT